MRIILHFFSCISFCFLVSCYSQTAKKKEKEFDSFPEKRQLNIINVFKVDSKPVDLIDLYNDSTVVLINRGVKEKHHFYLYDLSKKEFLPSVLEFGRKEGQSLSFISYGIEKEYLWAYDINREKIIFSKINTAQDSINRYVKELTVPGFYYSVQLLNDTTLVASGDYDSPVDYKITLLNLSNGQIKKQMASYSADTTKPFNRPQKMAYESFLFLKPSKDKCVLACRYADRIEIVNLNSSKTKVTRGPEGFEPDFVELTGNDGKKLSTRGPDTRYAFVQGKVTNKFIYLLYSGNKDGTIHRYYGKYIYVYNWDGTPIEKLELNDDIEDFAITSNDSLMYTYNPKSKYVGVVNIKKR